MQHKPQFIVAVPRLLETVFRGVQQTFAMEKGAKRALINFFSKVKKKKKRRTDTGMGRLDLLYDGGLKDDVGKPPPTRHSSPLIGFIRGINRPNKSIN